MFSYKFWFYPTCVFEDIHVTILQRRHSLFGPVRRLPEDTPAHAALKLSVNARGGLRLGPAWLRQLEVDHGSPAH